MSHRIMRLACAIAVGLGAAVGGAAIAAAPAGATGSTPTSFTITVNGANSTSSTTSAVSTLAWAGLPGDATGTVQFASGATVLCTVTLPAASCPSSSLSAGSYPAIAGTYSGDGTYAGSTSTNSVDLTVGATGGSSLVCRKVYGYVTKIATFAKCGVTQKGASFPGGDLLTGGTLVWGKGSTTDTTYTATATSPGQGSCGAGRVEYDVTGTVTADNSGHVTVGDAVSYRLCVNTTTHVVKFVLHTTASL